MSKFGRYWALFNRQCPNKAIATSYCCPDCPDDCPLDSYRVNGNIIGKNNAINHPEQFIDEYVFICKDDDYLLSYGEDGYYFIKEPAQWLEFVEEIGRHIF